MNTHTHTDSTQPTNGSSRVKEMQLTDLMRQFVPAWAPRPAFTWDTAVRDLEAAPDSAATIERLRRDAHAGRFRTPILIDEQAGLIVDGVRRVVAAHLAGTERIRVAAQLSALPSTSKVLIEMQVTALTDGEDGILYERLRSFPLADHWAVATSMGINIAYGYIGGYWSCPLGLEAQIGAALTHWSASFDYDIEIFGVYEEIPQFATPA